MSGIFTITVMRNGGASGSDQDLTWDYVSLDANGVVQLDGTSLLYHIFDGINFGYTRGDFTGLGGAFVADVSGPYNLIQQPPSDPVPVSPVDISAIQSHGVCTGMMVLEDEDYVEVGDVDFPGIFVIKSFKLVRVGIGNFL